MRLIILTKLFLIPLIGFASFPIQMSIPCDTIIESKEETIEEYKMRIQKQLYQSSSEKVIEKKNRSWILGYSSGLKYDYRKKSFPNEPKIGNHSFYAGYRFNYLATGLIINGGAGLFLKAYFSDNLYFNIESTLNPDPFFGLNTSATIYAIGYEIQLSEIVYFIPRISYYNIKDNVFADINPDPFIYHSAVVENKLNGILFNLGLQFNLGKENKK